LVKKYLDIIVTKESHLLQNETYFIVLIHKLLVLQLFLHNRIGLRICRDEYT
jgi:hypothetical protein